MKRIIGALAIAGVLFYLSFRGSDYICKISKEMSSQLEMCAEKIKYEQYDRAYEISDSLKKQWDESIKLLSIVLGDSAFLTLDKDIYSICRSIDDKSYENALALIRECQGCFEDIIDSQVLSLGNIL